MMFWLINLHNFASTAVNCGGSRKNENPQPSVHSPKPYPSIIHVNQV